MQTQLEGKMKLPRISFLFLLLFLFVPSVSYAQSTADKAWKPFWTKFSAAIAKKNRAVLKGMMKNPFLCGDGVCTPNEALQDIDKLKKWRSIQKSVTSGTKSWEKYSRDTTDGYLSFRFENGRWLWIGFLEDYG